MPKDRKELEKLTVVALRELAKKRLGSGTSKLRTKAQLLAALAEAGSPRPKGLAKVPPEKSRAKSAKAPGSSRRVRPVAAPKKAAPARQSGKPRRTPARSPKPRRKAPLVAASSAPEPLLALPLDGQTLLVRWGAIPLAEKGERWELEVSSDGRPSRTLRVTPEARHAYVRALAPGPVYRARLSALGAGGQRRLIGAASRPVVLFPAPESATPGERFVRYSWSDPAASARGVAHAPPGTALAPGAEGLAPETEASAASRSATSPTGPLAKPPLGGFSRPRRPTSFSH